MSKINYDEKPKSRFTVTRGNELARRAKAPVYLIDRLIEQDKHGIVYGASMAFKSFAVLEMAHCICTGRDFMGQKVKRKGAVIYVCGEGADSIDRRWKALIVTHGESENNDFCLLNESMSISNDDDMAELKLLISEIKPVLVIFDTFASLAHGINENDNGAVGSALNSIRDTCRTEFKTSSLIVHHTGKDDAKGSRGAYAFKANVDYEIELKRGNDYTTTMHCEKLKDGKHFNGIHMAAIEVDLGIFDDDMEESTSLVLKQIDAVKADKKKQLNKEESKILTKLREVLENDGITPPKSIIDLFPDSPQNAPQKVTTVSEWQKSAFDSITVDSSPEKADEAKRGAFRRARKKMDEYGYIGLDGDFVWLIKAS